MCGTPTRCWVVSWARTHCAVAIANNHSAVMNAEDRIMTSFWIRELFAYPMCHRRLVAANVSILDTFVCSEESGRPTKSDKGLQQTIFLTCPTNLRTFTPITGLRRVSKCPLRHTSEVAFKFHLSPSSLLLSRLTRLAAPYLVLGYQTSFPKTAPLERINLRYEHGFLEVALLPISHLSLSHPFEILSDARRSTPPR